MCIAKTPKMETPKEKEPTVIRNPYLDGVDPALKAMRSGRSGLRIERGVAGAASVPPPMMSQEPAPGSALNMDPKTNAFGKPLGVVGQFAKAVALKTGVAGTAAIMGKAGMPVPNSGKIARPVYWKGGA